MRSLLAWLIRNPVRSAALVGLAVSLVLSYVSFPRDETLEKTVEDWLPANAAGSGVTREDLLRSIEQFDQGKLVGVARISEAEFLALDLPLVTALPEASSDGRAFIVRYVGRQRLGDEALYLAERRIDSAPWWSPDRWVYKAARTEVEQAGKVLRLSFDRDVTGLISLLLIDLVVGGIYAAIVGMLLAVLGTESLGGKHSPGPAPAPSPFPGAERRGVYRA